MLVMCTLVFRDCVPFGKYLKRHVYPGIQGTHDERNQIQYSPSSWILSFSVSVSRLKQIPMAAGNKYISFKNHFKNFKCCNHQRPQTEKHQTRQTPDIITLRHFKNPKHNKCLLCSLLFCVLYLLCLDFLNLGFVVSSVRMYRHFCNNRFREFRKT